MLEEIPGNREINKVSSNSKVKDLDIRTGMTKDKDVVHSILVVTDSRGSLLWLQIGMLYLVKEFLVGHRCSGGTLSETYLCDKL